MTRTRMLGWAAMAPLLIVAVFSCRKEPAEEVRPSLLRLNDVLKTATLEAAFDLADDAAALLGDAVVHLDGRTAHSTAGVARHEGAWAKELYGGANGLWIGWAPVTAAQRTFWARLDGALEAEDAAWIVPVPQRNDAAAYGDATHAEKILRYLKALAIPLAPRPGGDDTGLEGTVVLAPDVQEVLVVVRGDAARIEASRLRLASLGPRGAWLGRAARDVRSPWIRSIKVAGVTRPSIILAAPARMVCRLTRPPAPGRLALHATRFFGPDRPARVTVGVRGGDVEREEILSLPKGARWYPFEMEVGGSSDELEVCLDVEGAAGSLVAIGAPMMTAPTDSDRPDVLLVSLDTVRADALSLYGAPDGSSPALAALAASSAVFERAISTAPWTLPAHTSLFTGQQPDRHDVHRELSSVPRDVAWLVDDFRRAGYRTEAWTGGGYLDPTFGFDQGFDRYAAVDPAFPNRAWAERRGNAHDITRAKAAEASRRDLLERLAEPDGGPRFLFAHTYAAHEYAADPALLTASGATPDRLDDLVQGLSTVDMMNRIRRDPALAKDPATIERARFLYRASVRTADEFLADVLAALDRSGRASRTIVVVVSDHGEELFERGAIGHAHQLHEELVRIPMVVRGPGVVPARIGDVVSLADVTPTLRELCRLSPPDGASFGASQDGRSLVPLLRGERLPARPALSHGSRPSGAGERIFRALRGRRIKFMREEGAAGRLFDLDADPGERSDLAASLASDAATQAGYLYTLVTALKSLRGEAGSAALSPELRKSLEALGYLGDSDD